MRERATLRLANGDELGVEVDPDELDRDEILDRRTTTTPPGATACWPSSTRTSRPPRPPRRDDRSAA
jgi:hypothetical protein